MRSSDSNDPRYIQEYEDGTTDIKFPGRKGDPTQAAFKILKAKAKTELEGLKERNALILSNDNSIYDELVMCCTGKALTVVQTVKTRSGFAAWNALVDEYGKVMIGDRTLLQRRLRTADVHGDGQTGMEEGDDVKDFITKLNALHTELYQTVPVEEHHSVPELTKESMRQVLFNSRWCLCETI